MFGGKSVRELRKEEKLVRGLVRRYRKRIPQTSHEALNAVLNRCAEAVASKDEVQATEVLNALAEVSETHLSPYRNSSLFETIESVGLAVVIALILRAFVIEAFTIPSGSMIPTLAVGDFLFVNKLAYGTHVPFTEKTGFVWDHPERGDIIVFVYPCNPKQDYIKRVVAVEGDVVMPYGQGGGYLVLNGEKTPQKSLREFHELAYFRGGEVGGASCPLGVSLHKETSGTRNFSTLHCNPMPSTPPTTVGLSISEWGAERSRAQACPSTYGFQLPAPYPWRVPKGHVFVMGDNRDNSQDSRFWGFVPVEAIKGKALFMWMSWDGAASWSRPWQKVRWERLFRPVHRLYEGD